MSKNIKLNSKNMFRIHPHIVCEYSEQYFIICLIDSYQNLLLIHLDIKYNIMYIVIQLYKFFIRNSDIFKIVLSTW